MRWSGATNKYGDYLDVACALVGKAPDAGLHRDEARRGEMLFRIADDVPLRFRRENIFHHLLGHHVGLKAGRRIPASTGSIAAPAEDLKAVSASRGSGRRRRALARRRGDAGSTDA